MNLNELSAAWNDLRNAALGRGTEPRVPAALAARVAREYEAWRAFLADAGVADDLAASVTASQWVERYRALAADVRMALPLEALEELPATPFERTRTVARGAVSVAKAGAMLAGVAGVAGVLWALAKGGRS